MLRISKSLNLDHIQERGQDDDEDEMAFFGSPRIDRTLSADLSADDAYSPRKDKSVDSQAYLARLKKRSDLIRELRAAYLRDVVVLKHQLEQLLTNDERLSLLAQWKKSIPSIDLRQHLMLYSPNEASLDIIPCETCGGSVEIIHHDSSEIEELSKALSHLDKNKDELRVIIATRGAQLEIMEKKMEMMGMEHNNQKRVLFNQMKQLRAEDEALKSQLTSANQIILTLRQENTDFKTMNAEHFVVRDRMQKAEVDNERLKSELRACEEGLQGSKDSAKLLRGKLTSKTKEAEEMTTKVQALQTEVDDCKKSVDRFKANADSYQRRNEKLKDLLEVSRKEVEDLQVAKSGLLQDLEQTQRQSTSEIESLEIMVDTLREEKEVLSFNLKDARETLTHSTMDKDQAEAAYNDIYISHGNYKEKASGEIAALKKEVAELTEKLKISQKEMDELKEKVPEHPVDMDVLTKVQEQLRKLEEENTKYRTPELSRGSRDEDPTRRRTDGRRVGVSVKDGTNADKKREENRKTKRLETATIPSSIVSYDKGAIIEETPSEQADDIESIPKKTIEKVPPTRTKKGTIAVLEDDTEGPVGDKSPPRDMKKKTMVSAAGEEEDDEEEGDNEKTPSTGKAKKKYKPVQRARGKPRAATTAGTTTTRKPITQKIDNAVCKVGSDAAGKCNDDATSTGAAVVDTSAVAIGKGQGREIGPGEPAQAAPVASTSGSALTDVLVTSDCNDGSKPNADVNEEGNSDMPMLRSLSSKRLTRLATLESKGENKQLLLKQSSLLILEDDDLAEEAGVSDSNMKETIFRAFTNISIEDDVESSMASQEGSDSDEDSNDDEFEVEISTNVAKTWGSFTKQLNNVLTDNLGESEANHITHVVAPVTIEFCSLLVKSSMGLWRAMKIVKRNADMMYKLRMISKYIAPLLGLTSVKAEKVEEATRDFRSMRVFDRKRENWMIAVGVNRDLMSVLCKEELDPDTGKLVESKPASYFGYDATSRTYKFEVALNTVTQMKSFNDSVLDELDEALKNIFLDWGDSKLQALRGGGGNDDDNFGFGRASEETIAKLYDKLNEAEQKNDMYEQRMEQLSKDLENAQQKIEELSPVAKRAAELQERNNILSKSLKETDTILGDLDIAHNELLERHAKLEAINVDTGTELEKSSLHIEKLTKQVESLEITLNMEQSLHKEAAMSLALQLERERARLNDLTSASMQTEPCLIDMATQTEFSVPLMSLRHKATSDIPRTASASNKRVFFPVVTPGHGHAHVPQPSLADTYPENSIGFDDHTVDSAFGWSSFADSSTDPHESRSLFAPTNRLDLRSAPTMRRNSKQLELGLPVVGRDGSLADSDRGIPPSPVYAKRRQFVPSNSSRGTASRNDILHLNHHTPIGWEATSSADRLARSASSKNMTGHSNATLSAQNIDDILHQQQHPMSPSSRAAAGRNIQQQFEHDRARLQTR